MAVRHRPLHQIEGHFKFCMKSPRTCFVLFYCLFLLAAPSVSHAARFPFHVQPHHVLTELQHALGASIEVEKQSSVPSEHDAHVVARELASAKPPVENVAHTDYICADSC